MTHSAVAYSSTAAASVQRPPATFHETLDRAADLLQSQDPYCPMEAIRVLRDGMHAARREFADEFAWRRFIKEGPRRHRALTLAHQDPFIARAFAKPRGYPGDAVILDFIYRHPANRRYIAESTPAGRASVGFSTNTPAPRAVRNRAWLLANEIDAVCARTPGAQILSMACGHLREAADSVALQSGAAGRLLAVDQDAASLAVVQDESSAFGVEVAECSVRSLLAREVRLGRFDFIYAAGLFDYLNDQVAGCSVAALFELLKPGGKLWVANFQPGIVDRAFMESFMDWWLTYRSAEDMFRIASAVPAYACASRRTFLEHESNIVFLELCR